MPQKALTLSIVIPVFNEEAYLKACLESIAAQVLSPDEVVVVDNNSTDKTAKIAASYKFVKLLKESKQGVAFARDRGLNAAGGDIIARIDGDSILPKDWTLEVLKAFSDAQVAAASGPVHYYDMPMPRGNYFINHSMCLYALVAAPACPFLFGTNMAIRRQAWAKIRRQLCAKNNIHEDIDLAIHLSNAGYKIAYDKSLLAGASGRRYNDRPRQFAAYIAMFRRAYKHHHLFNKTLYPAIFLWCLGYIIFHPTRKLWHNLYLARATNYPLSAQRRKNPMSAKI